MLSFDGYHDEMRFAEVYSTLGEHGYDLLYNPQHHNWAVFSEEHGQLFSGFLSLSQIENEPHFEDLFADDDEEEDDEFDEDDALSSVDLSEFRLHVVLPDLDDK